MSIFILKIMHASAKQVQTTYLVLTLLNTLAASLIWGINTIFLLNAGLTNIEAFAANAFFTIGQVLFEVPTGIVADSYGRRTSYLLGTITLSLSTLLYLGAWYIQAPFWMWAGSSILLGLGFTFFSGATEAWLVDALKFTGYNKPLETVFSKGQIVGGIAMLIGSASGGFIAQLTHLGVPYILRAFILMVNFFAAFVLMKDLGFVPSKSKKVRHDIKQILLNSYSLSMKKPAVRWIMLAAPFSTGVGFYAFYAMQPYLLKLYGNSEAYGIAGLAAAIVAGAQIAGGVLAPQIKRLFTKRTTILMINVVFSTLLLIAIGFTSHFFIAILLLIVWALISAASSPVRQAYLNGLIPSEQRATLLSFDSLISSTGGVFIQPVLGKVADMNGYSFSYVVGACIQFISFPFVLLASKTKASSDIIDKQEM